MSLSKLREMAKDREAWHAAVHGIAKSQPWLSDWTTSFNHQDMQTKITTRYHFLPRSLATIKKGQVITNVGNVEEKLNLHLPLVECKTVYLLWKIVWQFLKKLKIQLLHDPAISLLDIYPREVKTHAHTKACTWMLTVASLIKVKKKWKQSKCPLTRQTMEK